MSDPSLMRQTRISPPNPARRCLAWGEPAINVMSGGAGASHPGAGKAIDASFEPKNRPCARCGAVFETTPARRMLCARCFK